MIGYLLWFTTDKYSETKFFAFKKDALDEAVKLGIASNVRSINLKEVNINVITNDWLKESKGMVHD